MTRGLRVAVIGSGPSGMYAADALVSQSYHVVSVDVIDRLPVPFGLVRYGVAPDHFSIRSVRDTLDRIFDKPGVRFLGNIDVGVDISVVELHEYYDAIIFSYGASRDRSLGIPGEELDGSVAATDFVSWYCGHPDADRALFERLIPSATSVVVVGVGNVSVDVTRVLAKTLTELEETDMPQHVLDTLGRSTITEIHVLGRRGPAQATFTTKELRELGELDDADILVNPDDLVFDEASEATIAGDKSVARNIEIIREWSTRVRTGKTRVVHLHFLARPVELQGEGRVAGVVVERTSLDGNANAVGTGQTSVIATDLVVRSVGYRGTALDEVPFDVARNVIPHSEGRVQRDGSTVSGEYVAGWIKRGPTGIIGTNKKDANATVASLLNDAPDLIPPPLGTIEAIDARLALTEKVIVTTEGWRAIDRAEKSLGLVSGRERTTIHDRGALISATVTDEMSAKA